VNIEQRVGIVYQATVRFEVQIEFLSQKEEVSSRKRAIESSPVPETGRVPIVVSDLGEG
jgi:hypothetical protein